MPVFVSTENWTGCHGISAKKQVSVNLLGTIQMTQVFLKLIRKSRGNEACMTNVLITRPWILSFEFIAEE